MWTRADFERGLVFKYSSHRVLKTLEQLERKGGGFVVEHSRPPASLTLLFLVDAWPSFTD